MPMMLEVDRAEGIFIYDSKGKKYFDLNSGICVSSLGHRHPKVIKAIQQQLQKHMHTMVYGEHIQSPQLAFAELLSKQLPASLNSIYLLLSGSEAVETAMKLAKRYTGRSEIIACSHAYHGSTQGAESLRSDHDFSGPYLPLLPGIRFIDFNDKAALKKITSKPAAIILGPVQAEAGITVPNNEYLKAVRERCDETGTMMILDEALLESNLISAVVEKEKFIHQKLRHPIIKEIRSSGLMMAVQLTKKKYLKHVVAKTIEGGALIDYFLFNRDSFRLAPPLIYSIEELDEALDIILKAMDESQALYS